MAEPTNWWSAAETPATPAKRAPDPAGGPPRRSILKPLLLFVLAAVLGGVVALGGAAMVGALDEGTSTTVQQQAASASSASTVPAASGSALTVNEIYRRSGPGVVQITTTEGSSQALGSGFVLDKNGYIATNYHVVNGATSIKVRFSNDDTLKATLIGSDPSTDIALLKVDASPSALTPLTLANSDNVQVGDAVVAIGNPFGLERTVTTGIVSALQ